MSNYFNEAGEPLMDGAAMRYEMYLDSTYEPDPDDFYDRWDAEPDECDGCGEYPDECVCEDESSVPEDAMMEFGLFGDC